MPHFSVINNKTLLVKFCEHFIGKWYSVAIDLVTCPIFYV